MNNTRYDIIRFRRGGNAKILHRNVSLEVAQMHCNDERTRKAGKWFDGYRESKVK